MDLDGNLCYTEELASATQQCTYDPGLFTIHNVSSTTVTFTAKHTLKSRGYDVPKLNWFAAYFLQNGEPACMKYNKFKLNRELTFDAECVCGVAEIDIYSYSAYFHRDLDTAIVPDTCNDHCACVGRRCGYKFRIPCEDGPVPPACPVQRRLQAEEITEDGEPPVNEIKEKPEKSIGCASVWAYDRSNAQCLGQIRSGKPGWTNKMTAPSAPVSLDLHANQDGCRDVGFPVGKVWVSQTSGELKANFTVDTGFTILQTNMHAGRRRLPKRSANTEEMFDPELFPSSNLDVQDITDVLYTEVESDRVYFAAHAIVCGDFKAKEAEVEAAMAAYEDSLTCYKEVQVANHDFEDNFVQDWSEGAVISYNSALDSHFLGSIGEEVSTVAKTFTIPEGAEDITIQYDIYRLGPWDPEDVFYFMLWHSKHSVPLSRLPLPNLSTDAADKKAITTVATDTYSVTIPKAYIRAGGKFQLGFGVHWASGNSKVKQTKKSAGVDNLVLTAIAGRGRLCYSKTDIPDAASGFDHSRLSKSVSKSPTNEADTGYFCKAEDYTCDPEPKGNEDHSKENDSSGEMEKRMVQVCHYSSDRGYMTLCIQEEDSDFLRFSSHDYCGPCTGGYQQNFRDKQHQREQEQH